MPVFPYKAVLSDIDGTLLGPAGAVSALTVRAVGRLVRGGVPFALVTGRMPAGLTGVRAALGVPVPAVCYSGALVLDPQNRILSSSTIDSAWAAGVLSLARKRFRRLSPSYFSGLDWYVEDPEAPAILHEGDIVGARPQTGRFDALLERGMPPNKLFFSCAGNEELSAPLAEEITRAFPELTVIRSGRATMVEVLPPGVDKATGARALLAHLRIDPAETLAFGDDANDVPLLRLVGRGVAVGNGTEEAHRAADAVTRDAAHDGVARFLQGCWSQTNDRKVGTDATT